MTLHLDARQRAMLGELGIRLFDAPPANAPAAGSVSAAPDRAPAPQATSFAAQHAIKTIASHARQVRATGPFDSKNAVSGESGSLAPLPDGIEAMDWAALENSVAACRACALCHGRRNTVFGMGDPTADWLVVGDAPGEAEDLQGEPLAGQAGQLLDNMLAALGLDRQRKVYIANAIKCRPPGNRNPEPAEVALCHAYLGRQVALVQPKIIVAMGRFAVQSLLQTTEPIGKLRGRLHQFQGVPLVVTYHPAYLLRNLPDKARAWADLCLAADAVESAAPAMGYKPSAAS